MGSLIDQQCDDKRAEIISRARGFADLGSHYLWGAEGQQPGEANCKFSTTVLDPAQPQKTSFCAAVLGGCVCVGRFRAPDLTTKTPSQKVWDGVSGSGREDVLAFIKKYQATPNAHVGWWSDDGLTPRLVTGYPNPDGIPKDYGVGGGASLLGKIVWGEGCDDSLHFDCGGFVRYVSKFVCGLSIAGIKDNPSSPNPFGQPLGFLLKEGDAMLPADILCYDGHIAFADAGNGKYSVGGSYDIVQAEDAVNGVNYSKGGTAKKRGGHTKCIRLSPSTLLNRRV